MSYSYEEKMNFFIHADEAWEGIQSAVESLKVRINNCTSISKALMLKEELQAEELALTSCENQLRFIWFSDAVKGITGPFGIWGKAVDYFTAEEFGDVASLEFKENRLIINDNDIVDYKESQMVLTNEGILCFYRCDKYFGIEIQHWDNFMRLKAE